MLALLHHMKDGGFSACISGIILANASKEPIKGALAWNFFWEICFVCVFQLLFKVFFLEEEENSFCQIFLKVLFWVEASY